MRTSLISPWYPRGKSDQGRTKVTNSLLEVLGSILGTIFLLEMFWKHLGDALGNAFGDVLRVFRKHFQTFWKYFGNISRNTPGNISWKYSWRCFGTIFFEVFWKYLLEACWKCFSFRGVSFGDISSGNTSAYLILVTTAATSGCGNFFKWGEFFDS